MRRAPSPSIRCWRPSLSSRASSMVWPAVCIAHHNHPLNPISCHQASHGEDRRRLRSTRVVFVRHLSLCAWLHPDGGIAKHPGIRGGSDLLRGGLPGIADLAADLRGRHERPGQSCAVHQLARRAVSDHRLDWTLHRGQHPETLDLAMGLRHLDHHRTRGVLTAGHLAFGQLSESRYQGSTPSLSLEG